MYVYFEVEKKENLHDAALCSVVNILVQVFRCSSISVRPDGGVAEGWEPIRFELIE